MVPPILGDGYYLDSMELSRIRHMFALLGQAGRLGLRVKRARRGDQASAADPADHPARMRVLEQRPVSAQ